MCLHFSFHILNSYQENQKNHPDSYVETVGGGGGEGRRKKMIPLVQVSRDGAGPEQRHREVENSG